MSFAPRPSRYESMSYRRAGRSGLKLPAVSLGLWQNFGAGDDYETGRALLRHAFDRGVTHFDLANNYGPPPGSAEEMFGRVMAADLRPFRDELIVSTKAGYTMWPGPYGDFGSRKYLLASLDQSLKRMGLDHVDIFYSHRFDPDTPLEETMGALATAVKSGKALYAAISNYPAVETRRAAEILRGLGAPCLVHQPSYSILNRWIEDKLQAVLDAEGIGSVVFSPLAQGFLSGKYVDGVPAGSRAARAGTFPQKLLTEANIARLRGLAGIAKKRGQTLAQMAIAWVLRGGRVTSALVGARNTAQLDDILQALVQPEFTEEELAEIDGFALVDGRDLWRAEGLLNPILR
jgi:L-glyceraldehyde 3-phosphate reductase